MQELQTGGRPLLLRLSAYRNQVWTVRRHGEAGSGNCFFSDTSAANEDRKKRKAA